MQSVPLAQPGFKVLVIAHDFPPNPSPQSMRIGRLVDGLLADGCEVEVLAGSYRPHWGAAAHHEPQAGLTVTRGLPSMTDRFIDALRVWRRRILPDREGASTSSVDTLPALNWKGRLFFGLKDLLSGAFFPGESRGWLHAVRPVLIQRLQESKPDCIVLSHEPPAGLMLHRLCRQTGARVIAELGDPVCAPYTPMRWKRKAFRLESQICRSADHVVVTCEATRALLRKRHGISRERISVLTQGFLKAASRIEPQPTTGPLRLAYTGRFYPFRDPAALLAAVAALPDVELLIASPPTPGTAQRNLPPNVRVLGELPHAEALHMQATAHVLVNIANEGLPQIPGKFFEYFALPRPILHVACSGEDEQADLLRKMKRGWVVSNDESSITALLHELLTKHRDDQLTKGLDLANASVEAYAWTSIASRFALIVRNGATASALGATKQSLEHS